MDAKQSEDDDIVWSDHTMTIRDVIYSSMPAVVRVAQGYLGSTEAESFSRGDLLKLDFVKSIQKVYATVVSSWSEAILEDQTGYMQPDKEIIIPLGYRGKVYIMRPESEKPYRSVTELMRVFPRFVRVDVPFFAFSNEDEAIQIDAGKKLELDRYLPTKGLIAKFGAKTIVITDSVRSRFVPLEDLTQYTLMEVVERLPLPQFVRFVEDEFEKVLTTDLTEAVENVQNFTGCVKLKKVFREEVIVGHHKPQIPDYLKREGEKFVQRSIVLLPLGREAVNEIEVNIPIYSEPDEYELLVVRNFTQKSPNMDIVDGSLYLEFAKNPKGFYVLDDNEILPEEEFGPPPPLPPRPPRHGYEDDGDSTKPPMLPPRPEQEDYEVVSEPVKPPPLVPRSRANIRKQSTDSTSDVVTPSNFNNHDSYDEQDGPLMIYEVSDEPYSDDIKLPTREKHKVAVPMPFYKRLKRVHTELLSKLRPKGHSKPHHIETGAVTQPLPSPTSPLTPKAHALPHYPAFSSSQNSPESVSGKTLDKLQEMAKDNDRSKQYDMAKHPYVNTENKHGKPPKPRMRKGKVKSDDKATKKEHETLETKSSIEHISDEQNSDYDLPDQPKETNKTHDKKAKKGNKNPKGKSKLEHHADDKKTQTKLQTKTSVEHVSDEQDSDYEYPGQVQEKTKADIKLTKKGNKKIKAKDKVEHASGEQKPKAKNEMKSNVEKISDDHSSDDNYDYPDMSQIPIEPLHPQPQGRPVVRVQPSARQITKTTQSLSQMSVKELVTCLNQCALQKIATLCWENAIDGKFISGLKEEELRDTPFSMNSIEVTKLKRMKEGWRPKIE